MYYVDQVTTETLEIKQSKFIAYLTPYSKYNETLEALKNSHPKARHFVVAYRYLNEFSQIVEHSSDDGEPKGTSGKPTLMVLQGAEMINSAVITVRYFGGTKLGTGGLVRAYSDATNLVLNNTTLHEYKEEKTITITFEYSDIRKIEYECERMSIKIIDKQFSDKTIYRLQADKQIIEQFLLELDNRVVQEV